MSMQCRYLTHMFVVALVLVPTCVVAAPDTLFEHLPEATLVVARVARLDRLDRAIEPLATNFGVAVPQFGELVSQVDGIDATGEVAVGITEFEPGVYVPFVLLPVRDYKSFARAGDGDSGIDVTPLTLADSELLASRRGRWALVTNVIEPFSALGQLDKEVAGRVANTAEDSLLTVLVTDRGLSALQQAAQSLDQSPRQLANRRRILASQPFNWRSLDYWRQRASLQSDMVDRLHKQCSSVVLAIDLDDELRAQLAATFIPRSEQRQVEAPRAPAPIALADERTVATATCAWDSPWVEWLVQMHLSSFSAGSDDVGVVYFRDGEFDRFRKSVAEASSQVVSVSGFMIAPANNKPTMSDSALLLTVSDLSEFIAAFDAAVKDWNRMIETARRSGDFFLQTKQLEAGKRTGNRYTVDLPTAFRDNNVPEVRQVLDAMFGRNGAWTVDVLPIDDSRVLVSNLPDALRDKLADDIERAQSPSDVEAANFGWRIVIDPAVLQDWLNDVRRHTYGKDVVGWKPKSLHSTSKVEIRVTTHNPQLRIETEIPGDVMQAIGSLHRNQ